MGLVEFYRLLGGNDMKTKFYFWGILAILAVLIIVTLGADAIDMKAASKDEITSQAKDEMNEDTEIAGATKESANADIGTIQENYSVLVDKYNSVVLNAKDANLSEDETISEILTEAADLIKEMGQTDLSDIDEEDVADINESIEIVSNVLDEVNTDLIPLLAENNDFEMELKETSYKNEEPVLESVSLSDKKQIVTYEKPDFEIATLDGNNFKLSDNGGKIVVLNFWATWCGPCKEEMPDLQKLYDEYSKEDVVFLTIDCSDDAGTVKSFLDKNGYTLPTAVDGYCTVSDKYGVSAIPYTIIFDKDGSVVDEIEGTYGRDYTYEYISAVIETCK